MIRKPFMRKWSFVKPLKPGWLILVQAALAAIAANALFWLPIKVAPPQPLKEAERSAGITILSAKSMDKADFDRLNRWLILHDPTAFANAFASGGRAEAMLPRRNARTVQYAVPGLLPEPLTAPPAEFSALPLAGSGFSMLAPSLPVQKKAQLQPVIRILDSNGKILNVDLPPLNISDKVRSQTMLDLRRTGGLSRLSVTDSCGDPALDEKIRAILLTQADTLPQGILIVSWPSPRQGKNSPEKAAP